MKHYLLMCVIVLSAYAVANMTGYIEYQEMKDQVKRYKKVEVIKVDE